MTRLQLTLGLCVLSLMAGGTTSAQAAPITIASVLGNDAPGFNDGDMLTIVQLIAAQTAQPVPFNSGYGSDPIANFNQTYTHSYGAFAGVVTSAVLQFGIYDADSGGVGTNTAGTKIVTLADQQLDVFTGDGVSLVPELLAAGFEDTGQGLNNQYEVYTVILPAALFGHLLDGTFVVNLGLKGPVFSPGLFSDEVHDFNGAALIFSKLTIDYDSQAPQVPEPVLLLLLGPALAVAAARRRRSR